MTILMEIPTLRPCRRSHFDPPNKSKQTHKQTKKTKIMKLIFIDAFGLCRESFFKIEGLILAFVNWFELRENLYIPYTLASSYF